MKQTHEALSSQRRQVNPRPHRHGMRGSSCAGGLTQLVPGVARKFLSLSASSNRFRPSHATSVFVQSCDLNRHPTDKARRIDQKWDWPMGWFITTKSNKSEREQRTEQKKTRRVDEILHTVCPPTPSCLTLKSRVQNYWVGHDDDVFVALLLSCCLGCVFPLSLVLVVLGWRRVVVEGSQRPSFWSWTSTSEARKGQSVLTRSCVRAVSLSHTHTHSICVPLSLCVRVRIARRICVPTWMVP